MSCQDPTFLDPPTRAGSKTHCPGRQYKVLLGSSFSLVSSESWRLRKSMGVCMWQQRLPIVDVDGLTSKTHLLSASNSPSLQPCLPCFVHYSPPAGLCLRCTVQEAPESYLPTRITEGQLNVDNVERLNTHLHRDSLSRMTRSFNPASDFFAGDPH